MSISFTAKQIAEYLQGEVVGDEKIVIHTFAKIECGIPGSLTFHANSKYTPYIYTTKSSVVLVDKTFEPKAPVKATLIKVDDAYASVAKLLSLYESMKPKYTGISSLAFIAPTAKIGKDVLIAPFAVIGESAVIGDGAQIHPHVSVGVRAKIGSNTILYSNSVIYNDCVVGNNCILHSGCVIGADGFGFAPTKNGYSKIPQIGTVRIEDDVEIGANTCVDRSTMGETVIRQGVKLDNLIQVAHNVEIGKHTVIASQVGLSGSTKVGEWCRLGGQTGTVGHIRLGSHVSTGGQTGIMKDIPDNSKVMGTPCFKLQDYLRSTAIFQKLPELYNEIERLKQEVKELKRK